MTKLCFEVQNLALVGGLQAFWAKIIPKHVIDESNRYCERYPKRKFWSLNWGIPKPEQITAYQLALTLFGSDAVSGIDKEGYTDVTLDGQKMKLTIILDLMSSNNGFVIVIPFIPCVDGMAAANFASNSVFEYLKEHRYVDRVHRCLGSASRPMGEKEEDLPQLPPGLDELDEGKLVAGSANWSPR